VTPFNYPLPRRSGNWLALFPLPFLKELLRGVPRPVLFFPLLVPPGRKTRRVQCPKLFYVSACHREFSLLSFPIKISMRGVVGAAFCPPRGLKRVDAFSLFFPPLFQSVPALGQSVSRSPPPVNTGSPCGSLCVVSFFPSLLPRNGTGLSVVPLPPPRGDAIPLFYGPW